MKNNIGKKHFSIAAYFSVALGCGALLAGCGSAPVASTNNSAAPNQVDTKSSGDAAKPGLRTLTTKLEFRPQPKEIVAGARSIWGLKVIDLKTQKGPADFKLSHEKLMHLIIVSKDLSWFNHVHPEFKGYGNFIIETVIPQAGDFKLYADYTPIRSTQEVAQKEFKVKLAAQNGMSHLPAAILVPDKAKNGWMTNNVNAHPESQPDAPGGTSYQVALMPMPAKGAQMKAGEPVMLHFQVRDASGKPVKDLQPYLGAMGHAVLISQDTNIYLHSHPVESSSSAAHAHADGDHAADKMNHGATSGAADVIFHTTFPTPGIYKVWGQFRHNDQIITASFVLNIAPGGAAKILQSANAIYFCEMHPEVTSTDPNARCPKCNMALIKKEAKEITKTKETHDH